MVNYSAIYEPFHSRRNDQDQRNFSKLPRNFGEPATYYSKTDLATHNLINERQFIRNDIQNQLCAA